MRMSQESVDGVARDPLVNLKRLGENRPGFHWRATPSLKGSDIEKGGQSKKQVIVQAPRLQSPSFTEEAHWQIAALANDGPGRAETDVLSQSVVTACHSMLSQLVTVAAGSIW
jgi:hypothetical protein